MDTAKDNEGASLLCKMPDCITSQCIPGVDANANDIAALNRIWLKRFQSFVVWDGISKVVRCRCCQHK
jgi:hypothetical protein